MAPLMIAAPTHLSIVGESAAPAEIGPPGAMHREQLPVEYVLAGAPPADLATVDTLLLEATRETAHKAYIARYRLATLDGEYLMRITRDGSDWVIACPLDRYPAPALASGVSPATPIDAIARVTLVYSAPAGKGTTVQKSQEFQSIMLRPDGVVATLRVGAVPDQDEIYNALTDPRSNAQLTVWRDPRIGVPVPASPPGAAERADEIRGLSAGPLAEIQVFRRPGVLVTTVAPVLLESFTGAPGFAPGLPVRVRTLNGERCLVGTAPQVSVVPVTSPADQAQQVVFRPMPDLIGMWGGGGMWPGASHMRPFRPNGELLMQAYPWPPPTMAMVAEGWCVVRMLPANHPAQQAKEELIARKKTELEALQRAYATSWFAIRQPSLPLDLEPQPFCIPPDIHAAVYAGVKPAGVAAGSLRRLACGTNVYYQDLQQRQRFYYLPDRFELTPRGDAPWPNLRVRAAAEADTFFVEYMAGPIVDQDRLERDAAAALLGEANRLASRPVERLDFEPLLGDTVSLALMVPGAGGWQLRPRAGTVTDLYHAFTDVVSVDSAGLRLLYDALFDTQATLFHGTIDVTLGTPPTAWAHHVVPLVARVTGSRQAFWDAAIDPTVSATRQRTIDVVADAAMFAASSYVDILFECGAVLLLTKSHSIGRTTIAQPIADYVLGMPDSGKYRYQLRGTIDGVDVTSEWKTGESSTLRLASW
jgi:hypothetical protein